MSSLYDEMRKGAEKNPSAPAIVFYNKRYNYRQILDLVERTAAGFEGLGIGENTVVTLCLPNSPSAFVAFYALNRLGAVVNLVHPLSSAALLDKNLKESKSEFLIAYDLFLGEKGGQLITKIPVLTSRSDYFMGLVTKVAFRLLNRSKIKQNPLKTLVFEDLFASERIKTPPVPDKKGKAAVYLPSGGTSGSPKIIMHTSDVFNQLCAKASYFLSEPLENYIGMYSVLPIFHGFGLCMNMHMCATLGLKSVMSLKFDAKSMLKAIKKERVNVVTGVPAMYSKLLACKKLAKSDLSSIKDCFVGGDSAPYQLVKDFNAALKRQGSGGALYVGYGLTETISVCVVTCKNHVKPESIGYPLPDVSVKILAVQGSANFEQNPLKSQLLSQKSGCADAEKLGLPAENGDKELLEIDGRTEVETGEIGEICISTPLLMLGYLDESASPIRQAGGKNWLLSGDLGYVDADGFLYFKQRIKNMIKVNGVPVFPSEIEEVAESVAGVTRAAALGVADEKTGEVAKLFVESKREDTNALRQEIISQCRLKLDPYSVPKYIEVRPALPLNAIGKVDRRKLE